MATIPGIWTISKAGGGSPICTFDTFISLRFRTGSGLPVLPVEEGGFIPANKWMTPFEATITLAKAGEASDIENMMIALNIYKNSTDLVDIITPFYAFIDGNIMEVEYNFSTDETGSSMAIPSISIQEIRSPNDGSSFSGMSGGGCQNPENVSTTDRGECQSQTYGGALA